MSRYRNIPAPFNPLSAKRFRRFVPLHVKGDVE